MSRARRREPRVNFASLLGLITWITVIIVGVALGNWLMGAAGAVAGGLLGVLVGWLAGAGVLGLAQYVLDAIFLRTSARPRQRDDSPKGGC